MREGLRDRVISGAGARLIGALVLGAAVVGGGVALEAAVGPRSATPDVVPAGVSGGWFCPHGGGKGWRAWVVVGNPSDRQVGVQVTSFGRKGRPRAQAESVAPGTQRYVEVPAERMASGTQVEFFGGHVAVASVVRAPGDGGLAAEPCASGTGTRWFLPEGTTSGDHEQYVVVLNPFPDEAVLDMSLFEKRGRLDPGELTGVVLGPRRAAAFALHRLVLGEETLATSIRGSLGRVAVAAVGVGPSNLRATIGVPAPSRLWVLPGAGDEGETDLLVQTPARRAAFRVRVQAQERQGEVLEADVKGQAANTFTLPADGLGLVVQASGKHPFVAGRRLHSEEDLAAVSGAPGGARAWAAPPATGPRGGRSLLVLQNAEDEGVAVARIELLTADGRAEVPSLAQVTIAPGRARVIDLSGLVGEEPVTALVDVGRGTLVAAQMGFAEGGYGASLGIPLEPSFLD